MMYTTIVFDFDGVFTDNKVYVDQYGNESVMCDRGDGLGISLLRKFITDTSANINLLIVSTEANPVVVQRAQKLCIQSFHGINDKLDFISQYLYNDDLPPSIFQGLIYLGNDLNDLDVILRSQVSFCPSDAHPMIKAASTFELTSSGGHGFVRQFVELVLRDSLFPQMLD